MKLNKVEVIGIEKVNIKDKQTGKVTVIYRYYFIVGDCDISGVKVDSAYSTKIINDKYIPVIQIENNGIRKYNNYYRI